MEEGKGQEFKMRTRTKSLGFTLMELLIVIIVIAVLAAIALPKFGNSSTRAREASLRSHLREIRNAVGRFSNDCGAYPANLTDLAASAAPASGVDQTGAARTIRASDWHGPYLQTLNNDPISGNAFNYVTTSPNVGKVTSSASGNALDGTAYSGW